MLNTWFATLGLKLVLLTTVMEWHFRDGASLGNSYRLCIVTGWLDQNIGNIYGASTELLEKTNFINILVDQKT